MTAPGNIEVPFDVVLERFASEVAAMTKRAVIAESQVLALQVQLAQAQILANPVSDAAMAAPEAAAPPT